MPKIEEMFAFVACDEDADDEGVMAVLTGDVWIPLVGADMDRVDSLKPIADKAAAEAGKPYKILKFRLVETIEGD